MPELTRSQPDKWITPMRDVPNTKLNPDETLTMILHFETIKNNTKIDHTMFAVIRKGNKVIGRNIVSHDEGNGFICQGHAHDFVEYPIENQKELIKEVRNHGLAVAIALATGVSTEIKLNIEHPAFYLQTPENSTNAGVMAKFAENKDPQGETAKQVITDVFGLREAAFPQLTNLAKKLFATSTTPVKKETKETKATNNLAKAAKELELINKYGKKAIQTLAKKMNYEWAGHKYTRKTIKNKPTQNVK